ncbi:MAG: acyl-CoA dehydrogenase family protein [Pirellulales bacterium]|nr:acyl-CoA dehydrogenase family protein [Pirellulales bacterium]
MEFGWTSEQKTLFDSIERFARKSLGQELIERDRAAEFDLAGWRECGKFGIQGLPVPEDYGGLGLDAVTTVGALERLGYACADNGLVFSLNAHLWTAAMPLVAFGTEEQKQRYLPGLCSGELIGGNAMSEPDTGSDSYALRTSATRQGDRYVLNGSKIWVTNGPVADLLVVFATVDRAQGARGITAFLVDKHTPGMTVGRKLDKMGLRTSPMAELFFENCEVPEQNRLGREGAGTSLFTHSMSWERGCILASAVGSMQRLLETCVQHARQRKQFGQSIGKFQSVANKVVDMKLRLETARQLLYHGAWLRSLGKSALMEASMAKLYLSESWVQTCLDALQLHGAAGYMTEFQIERELRDALASRIYSGTNEIQRTLIASLLGL